MQTSLPWFAPLDWESPKQVVSERRSMAMPLDQFPPEKQQEIAEDVAADRPPERWLALGHPDSPRPIAWIERRSWYEWHWQRGIDPDKKREPIPSWMRAVVIERDGHICWICGGDVDPTDIHLDHIKPVVLGGPTEVDNLRVTHSLCNLRKGARY